MYFHDLYFVLVMFIRVQYQQWDPGISLFHLTWSSSSIVGLRQQTSLQLFEFILAEKCSYFLCGVHFERWIQFSHAWFSWHLIIEISHHPCIKIIWDPGIIFGLIGFNFGAALEIYSPLEKMIVIRVVQQQAWWFLYEIFLEY